MKKIIKSLKPYTDIIATVGAILFMTVFRNVSDRYYDWKAKKGGYYHIAHPESEEARRIREQERLEDEEFKNKLKKEYPELFLECLPTSQELFYEPINEFEGIEKEAYKGLIWDSERKGWSSPSAITNRTQKGLEHKLEERPHRIEKKVSKMAYAKIPKIRNNNPGNLRAIPGKKWKGQIGVDSRGFCIFDTLENGLRAMGRNLQDYNKLYDADTIKEIIERWAPKHENDTYRYIARVSQELGYHPNERLNIRDKNTVSNLISAIVKQEHGKYIPEDLIKRAIRDI